MTTESKLQSSGVVRGLLDPSPSELFDLHRYNADGELEKHQIRVRKLRAQETIDALKAAQDDAKKIGELEGYADIYRESQAVQVLLRAICDPDIAIENGVKKLRRKFVTAEQLRASLDETELAQCLNMYEIVKAKFGAIENMDAEQIDKYVDRLADELQGPLFLSLLDSKQWPLLIFTLARLVQSLRPPTTPTPSSSDDTSGSIPSTSPSGTSTSSKLPSAHSADGTLTLPQSELLSASSARTLAHAERPPWSDETTKDEPPAEPEG